MALRPPRDLELEELGPAALETGPDPAEHPEARRSSVDGASASAAGDAHRASGWTYASERESAAAPPPRGPNNRRPPRGRGPLRGDDLFAAGAFHRRSSSAPGLWSQATAADDPSEDGADEPSPSPSTSRRASGDAERASRSRDSGPFSSFSSQLTRPEWMIDVPEDLAEAWLVMPRPEGRRSLVIASRGWTIARLQCGRIQNKFPSALPGGSPETMHGRAEDAFCILDCVFDERSRTYHVLDCLAWNGMSLYDCAAEMRLSWLHAKLGHPEIAECDAARASTPTRRNAFLFAAAPSFPCDAEGVRRAYATEPCGFRRDGLLFLAKDGDYALGSTPLALLWKDAVCSARLLDENPGAADPERQRIVLRLDAATGDVRTGDDEPIALARLPREFIRADSGVDDEPSTAEMGGEGGAGGGIGGGAAARGGGGGGGGGGLRDGALLRFAVGDGGLAIRDGAPVGGDLVYEGLARRRGGRGADAATKIVFQYNARRDPMAIEEILRAVEESGESVEEMTC